MHYNTFAPFKNPCDHRGFVADVHGDGYIAMSPFKDLEVVVHISSGSEKMMQWMIEMFHFKIGVAFLPVHAVYTRFKRVTMIRVIYGQVKIEPQANVAPVQVNTT